MAVIEGNGSCTRVILFHGGIELHVVFRGRRGWAGVINWNSQNFVKCRLVTIIQGSQLRCMCPCHWEAFQAGYDGDKKAQ